MSAKDDDIKKQYTAQDIERYVRRQMSAAEMHALEKASLEDPFLAAAIEGYMDTPPVSLPADIEELKERLSGKEQPKIIPFRNKKIWWSAAAAIILILGTSITWYWLKPNSENTIAQQKEKVVPADSLKITAAPSETASQNNDSTTLHSLLPEKKETVKPSAQQEQSQAASPAIVTNKSNQQLQDSIIKSSVAGKTPGLSANKESVGAVEKTDRLRNEEAEADKIVSKDISDYKNAPGVHAAEPGKLNNAAGYLASNIFKGRVTDEANKPLPFVNISLNNAATSTYSDAQGNFTFVSGDTQLVVNIKSVGFEQQQSTIHAHLSANNIMLTPDKKSLSEIVVSGYGAKKKKSKGIQDDEKEEAEAEPVDGRGNYDIYLDNNKRLPDPKLNTSGGFVEISFTVDKYGNLYNFRIENSTCTPCNKELIRLIKEGPKWKLSEGNIPQKTTINIQF